MAKAAGEGHRDIHCRHTGSTRMTGVCCSMTSETRIAQGDVPGSRQGRLLASRAYQSRIRLWSSDGGTLTDAVPLTFAAAALVEDRGCPERGTDQT